MDSAPLAATAVQAAAAAAAAASSHQAAADKCIVHHRPFYKIAPVVGLEGECVTSFSSMDHRCSIDGTV